MTLFAMGCFLRDKTADGPPKTLVWLKFDGGSIGDIENLLKVGGDSALFIGVFYKKKNSKNVLFLKEFFP